jgi:NAD(P)H-flavin reductase
MTATAPGSGTGLACWDAVVVAHHRPAPDIAVLTVRPDQPYEFRPGQYLTLQAPGRSRLWRPYSIANAPRPDGTLELHVRVVPAGEVSGALVRHTAVGDRLRLGPPLGTMQVDPGSDRDLLFLAGGTGLAPCKAMLEDIARGNARRQVALFYGARKTDDLYGLSALFRFAQGSPWLTVIGAVSEDPDYFGRRGLVCDVATDAGDWSGHDVYVSGPPAMIPATVDTLRRHGVPAAHICYDPVAAPA